MQSSLLLSPGQAKRKHWPGLKYTIYRTQLIHSLHLFFFFVLFYGLRGTSRVLQCRARIYGDDDKLRRLRLCSNIEYKWIRGLNSQIHETPPLIIPLKEFTAHQDPRTARVLLGPAYRSVLVLRVAASILGRRMRGGGGAAVVALSVD